MSKLASLAAAEASPPANAFMLALQSWLLPAADHHNEITRRDTYNHIKPALAGVTLCLYFSGKTHIWSNHVAEKITVNTTSVSLSAVVVSVCESVCISVCLFLWLFVCPRECMRRRVCVCVFMSTSVFVSESVCVLMCVCAAFALRCDRAVWHCVALYVSGL